MVIESYEDVIFIVWLDALVVFMVVPCQIFLGFWRHYWTLLLGSLEGGPCLGIQMNYVEFRQSLESICGIVT